MKFLATLQKEIESVSPVILITKGDTWLTVTCGGETMKLFYLSWVLGMLSYIIGGMFRRFGSPLSEMSIGTQGLATFLLLILPAGIGAVLGVMSLKRKEVKSWWTVGVIVLNIAMALAGISVLVPG